MSEAITRLNAALEGRYRIESELGEGGHSETGVSSGCRPRNMTVPGLRQVYFLEDEQ